MTRYALAVLVVFLTLASAPARAQCPVQGEFTTPDPIDYFGRGLSVGRGFVAASAPNDSSISNQEGKLFIYNDTAGTWSLSATIQPANLDPIDLFGFSVAADGSRVAASALFDDDQGVDSGAVYVYRLEDVGWVFEQKLVSPVPGDQLNYGRAIALSGDVLAVVRWTPPAVVYIYRRVGTSWTLEATLSPSFLDQRYGTDVAVAGSVVVVGDPEYGISEGAIEVYRYTSGVGWQSEYVAFGSVGSSFGFSVDTYRGRVVAGAWEAGAGVAEVHRYSTQTSSWSLEQTLVGSDSASGDGFGYTVSIADSGIYVGAPGNNSLAPGAGAVYAFTLSGSVWTQVNKIVPSNLISGDNFATTMDATNNVLAAANRFLPSFLDHRAVYILAPCP